MKADDDLRRLAREYADAYGEKLLAQRGALPAATPQEDAALNSLGARVAEQAASYRRSRRLRVMGAVSGIAAALVILLLSMPLTSRLLPPSVSQEFAAEPAAPAAEAGQPVTGSDVPAAGTDAPAAEAGQPVAGSDAPAAGPAATQPVYELIPLSFELTSNLSISEVLQDREKTVYKLDDTLRDDVVLTLQYADAPETEGLYEISIDSHAAYCKYGADYSLLTFAKDGLLYTMTCRHDLNTLLDLGRRVL